MRGRIEKWKQMEAAGDPGADDYLKEITAEAQAEGKINEMEEAVRWLMHSAETRLDNVEESIAAHRC
jgi:hypothetical protein